MNKPLFELGQVVATPGALQALEELGVQTQTLLARHTSGDWGDLGAEDKTENQFALDKYLRIFSSYKLNDETTIWVITEADRSATTLLLPEDY